MFQDSENADRVARGLPSRGIAASARQPRGEPASLYGRRMKKPSPSSTPPSNSPDESLDEATPRDVECDVFVVEVGNFRDAPQVQGQPDVSPRAWQIAEDQDQCRHLLCLLATSDTTRVTTPIVDIDLGRRCVTTRSARRYHLATPPTHEPVVLAAMAVHAARFGLKVAPDMSEDIWSRMLRAVH
jgi:hypothetical protein